MSWKSIQKLNISQETVDTIFISFLVSCFLISVFFIGFNLLFYCLTVLISFLITLRNPRSGIYAIVFLAIIFEKFFTLQAIYIGDNEYKLFLPDILMGAIIISLFFKRLMGQKKKFEFIKADYFLGGFVLLASIHFMVSLFIYGREFSLAFSSFKYYAFYPIIYFLIPILFKRKNKLIRLFKFGLAGTLLIIVFFGVGLVTGKGIWTDITWLSTGGSRLLGARHAFYLSMAVISLLSYLLVKKRLIERKEKFLIFLWIFGIIGALMRNIWLGLFFALIIIYRLISISEKKIFKKILFEYGMILILVVVFLLQLSLVFPTTKLSQKTDNMLTSVSLRIKSFSHISRDQSVFWRYQVWKSAFKEYGQNPIVGMGLGRKVSVEMNENNYRSFVDVRHIHNSFLSILFQLGIIPFSLFFSWIFLILKQLYKTQRNWLKVALMGLIVNFLVVSLFQPYLDSNSTAIFFWLIMGLSHSAITFKNNLL